MNAPEHRNSASDSGKFGKLGTNCSILTVMPNTIASTKPLCDDLYALFYSVAPMRRVVGSNKPST